MPCPVFLMLNRDGSSTSRWRWKRNEMIVNKYCRPILKLAAVLMTTSIAVAMTVKLLQVLDVPLKRSTREGKLRHKSLDNYSALAFSLFFSILSCVYFIFAFTMKTEPHKDPRSEGRRITLKRLLNWFGHERVEWILRSHRRRFRLLLFWEINCVGKCIRACKASPRKTSSVKNLSKKIYIYSFGYRVWNFAELLPFHLFLHLLPKYFLFIALYPSPRKRMLVRGS